MPNLHRIPEAITDLDTQEAPNIRATALKYELISKALENRQKGKLVSMEEAVSMYCQVLTNAKEKALVGIINQLTNYRMPLTSAIIKNLTEEIRGALIEKNQIASFVE